VTTTAGRHDWITLVEAAAQLGLNERTLRRAAKDGHLATRRSGKIWLTTAAAAETWLKGARHRPGRKPQRRTPDAAPTSSASTASAIAPPALV
jgi:excisionase family DNA binding protein